MTGQLTEQPRSLLIAAVSLLALTWLAGGCQGDRPLTQEPEWIQRHVLRITDPTTYHDPTWPVLSESELRHGADYVRAHPDETSFHVLLIVRSRSPRIYEDLPLDTRAKVICDAMAQLMLLNEFGCLEPKDPYDGPAAKALIEIGGPALLRLRPLLDDERPALLWGGEEAMLTEEYQLRRADYAYRSATLILGREPVFHEDINLRDQLLAELRAELDTTLVLPAAPCPE